MGLVTTTAEGWSVDAAEAGCCATAGLFTGMTAGAAAIGLVASFLVLQAEMTNRENSTIASIIAITNDDDKLKEIVVSESMHRLNPVLKKDETTEDLQIKTIESKNDQQIIELFTSLLKKKSDK